MSKRGVSRDDVIEQALREYRQLPEWMKNRASGNGHLYSKKEK